MDSKPSTSRTDPGTSRAGPSKNRAELSAMRAKLSSSISEDDGYYWSPRHPGLCIYFPMMDEIVQELRDKNNMLIKVGEPWTGSSVELHTTMLFAICDGIKVSNYVKFKAVALLEKLMANKAHARFLRKYPHGISFALKENYLKLVICIWLAYKHEYTYGPEVAKIQETLRHLRGFYEIEKIRVVEFLVFKELDFKLEYESHLEFCDWVLFYVHHVYNVGRRKHRFLCHKILEVIYPKRDNLYNQVSEHIRTVLEMDEIEKDIMNLKRDYLLFVNSLVYAAACKLNRPDKTLELRRMTRGFGLKKDIVMEYAQCILSFHEANKTNKFVLEFSYPW